MASKNKSGCEIRKPKQAAKPKASKAGTDASKVERLTKLPHGR